MQVRARGRPYKRLSKAAKARALDDWRSDWDCFDDEFVKADFIEQGKERGFDISKIHWSGFWNQGDGASWVGELSMTTYVQWLRAQHELKNTVPPAYLTVLEALAQNACAVPVKSSGRECHEYSMRLDSGYSFEIGDDEVVAEGIFQGANCRELYKALPFDLPEWLLEAARDFARDIYKALEEAYDYQTSAESFANMCEGNDWRFDSDGGFIPHPRPAAPATTPARRQLADNVSA